MTLEEYRTAVLLARETSKAIALALLTKKEGK